MRKFPKITITLLLALCILAGTMPGAYALEDPRLKSSDACLLVDMDSGQILYEKEKDMQHSIASLTKIVTVLLAVEAVEKGQCNLDDMVTASSHFRDYMDTSSSNAEIVEGETMSYQDLMYCALVHSANEACNILAEYIAGDIQSFVKMMNTRVRELGCSNTQFVDCSGMNNRSEGHYSTPWELYLITKEALRHELFYQICSTVDYTVTTSDKRAPFELHNTNALVSPDGMYGDGYLYEGTVGVKTGFTKPAGYCLISTCTRNGKHLMAVVLGCNGPLTYTEVPGEYQNFMDSAILYDWGFDNFSFKTIFLAGEVLDRQTVPFAAGDESVSFCPADNIQLLLPNDINDNQISVKVIPEDDLAAPIEKGDRIGEIQVYLGGELFKKVDAVAGESIAAKKSDVIINSIRAFFTSEGFKTGIWLALTALVLGIAASAFIKYQKRKKLRAKMAARKRRQAAAAARARAPQNNVRPQQYRERPVRETIYREEEPRPQPQPRQPETRRPEPEMPGERQTIDLEAILDELGIEYEYRDRNN